MINLFCSIGWLGAAALGSAVGSGVNSLFGLGQNAIQYNQQKKLMQTQFEYQKQMYDYTFDKQNQYNLPSEQLARMKQAGLNPNLAYGQIQAAGSSGVTGSSLNASPPPLNAHQVDLASMVQADSQRSLSNTQQDLNKSQEDYNKAETQGKIIENAFNARKYGGENGNRLASALLKTAENQADYWEQHADHESVLRNNEVINSALLVSKERNINAQTSLVLLQAISEGYKPQLIIKQMQDIDSKISEREATIAYLQAMKELTKGKKEYQDMLNENFDKKTNHELAKMASEIYNNYFGGTNPAKFIHFNKWNENDIDKNGTLIQY